MSDRRLRRDWLRLLVAAGAFAVVLLLSYVGGLLTVLTHPAGTSVSQSSAWELRYYLSAFIKNVTTTLVFPTFAGPISLYLAPYLPLFALTVLLGRRVPGLLSGLMRLVAFLVALYALGIVLHGVEFTRARLPSAMRYHLAILPFLANLTLVYHLRDAAKILAYLRVRRLRLGVFCASLLGASFLAAKAWYNPESWALLAFNGLEIEPKPATWRVTGLLALAVFPALFSFGALWGQRLSIDRAPGLALSAAFALLNAGLYYTEGLCSADP